MHFTLAVSALAALTSTVAAQSMAIVKNHCSFPVYYKLNGMGGMTSPTYTLAASSGVYSENFRGMGSAILLGSMPQLAKPLTFEYSPDGSIVYYDLSDNAGNPFSGFNNTLLTSVASCYNFRCAPGSGSACYSDSASLKIQTCAETTNLIVNLCAANLSAIAPP